MEGEKNETSQCCQHKHKSGRGRGVSGCVYGLAFIGALIYYVQNATTFWVGVLGVVKALFWPAVVMYKLLGFLKM